LETHCRDDSFEKYCADPVPRPKVLQEVREIEKIYLGLGNFGLINNYVATTIPACPQHDANPNKNGAQEYGEWNSVAVALNPAVASVPIRRKNPKIKPNPNAPDSEKSQLMEMGFGDYEVRTALRKYRNDFSRALNSLLNKSESTKKPMVAEKPKNQDAILTCTGSVGDGGLGCG